jgi:hypothetical protein
LSQFIYFVFMTVAVDMRPAGKLIRKLLLVAAELVAILARQALEKLFEAPREFQPPMFMKRCKVPPAEKTEL